MLDKVLSPVVVDQRGQLGCWQMRDFLCGANDGGDIAVGTIREKGRSLLRVGYFLGALSMSVS